MATDLIDTVLAEMRKTGKPGSSMATAPNVKPKLEPGELTSSPKLSSIPPFPRYPAGPGRPMRISDAPGSSSAARHYTSGPIPAPGTPQDRFAAVIGRSSNRIVPITVMGASPNMMYPNPPTPRASTVDMPVAGSRGGSYPSQPAIYAMPNPATTTARNAPTGSAVDISVASDGSGNGSGGRGPALPPPFAPATQWLSYECQRRHFNPEIQIKESRTNAGEARYQCTIILKDIVVRCNTQFHSTADAKAHVAQKAIKHVRHEWPMAGLTRERGRVSTTSGNPQVRDPIRRQEELRQQLMRRRQTRSAESPRPGPLEPSGIDMSDQAQARAFVEGFRMGQLTAQRAAAGHGSLSASAKMSQIPVRSRSRSPTLNNGGSHSSGDHRHRCRSPLRDLSNAKGCPSSPPRYHDGSRHDPRLPSTDRYRPCHSDENLKHGRLTEFDEALHGH